MRRITVILAMIVPMFVLSCSCGGKNGGSSTHNDFIVTTHGGSDNASWDEIALTATALPPVQINVDNDSRSWIYANVLRSGEAWIMKTGDDLSSGEAQSLARRTSIRSDGWPAGLPAGYELSFPRYGYPSGTALNDGEEAQTFLHGVWVLTWEGTGTVSLRASENNGIGYTTLLDDTAHRRIVALYTSSFKYPIVYVSESSVSDPIRNVKLWAPAWDGAGLSLTASSVLTPGNVEGSLEPAPGEDEPFFHPVFLSHIRQAGPGIALRMMAFLDINNTTWTVNELNWADRGDQSYSFGSLSVPDSSWVRHDVGGYHQKLGIPYEWLIDLCNETDNDLWIQVPHVASEDLIRNLARLVAGKNGHAGLKSGLRVWFEFSNEIWNGYGPYLPQHDQAAEVAANHFGVDEGDVTTAQHGWGSGHVQGWALAIFEDEWAKCEGADDRLVNVVAGFANGPEYNRAIIEAVKEINTALPETLAITNYFGYSASAEIFALQDWSASDGETWSNSLVSQTKGAIRRNLYDTYSYWLANGQVARDEGVHLVSYEGGQHLLCVGLGDGSDPDFQKFMNYLSWLQRNDIMKQFYIEHYALWSAAGGRTASLFVDIGQHSYWGYWGAKEWVTETRASAKKWDAFLSWTETMDGVRAAGEPVNSAPSLEDVLIKAEVGIPFSTTIGSSGGDGAVSVHMIGGELPSGLAFTPGSGSANLSGTPESTTTSRIIVRALDADDDPSYRVYTISVDPEGMSTNAILCFNGEDIPSTPQADDSLNGRYDPTRGYESWGTSNQKYGIPFSMADGSALFNQEYADSSTTGGGIISATNQCNMYGGWCVTQLDLGVPVCASSYTTLRSNEFQSWSGANYNGTGAATALDIFLSWRKDQFTGNTDDSVYGFGSTTMSATMRVDFTNVIPDGDNELRFAVLDGSTWYVSEKAYTENYVGDGFLELVGFNNSSVAGNRWAVITPSTYSFAIPASAAFTAHSFTDIRAVGLLYHGTRNGYHYMFSFNRFAVLGNRN